VRTILDELLTIQIDAPRADVPLSYAWSDRYDQSGVEMMNGQGIIAASDVGPVA
jgi:hypothetical protein